LPARAPRCAPGRRALHRRSSQLHPHTPPPPWFLASCFWLLASPVCAVPQRSNNAAASSQERPRVPSPNLLFLAPCPSLQQLQAQQAQQATLQPEPDFGPPLSVAVVCSGFVWP
jgi:hypothetical protein